MSKKRLLICEEALKTFDGHWYEYNKAVVVMNRDGEAETTVLGHQEMSSEIAEELGGIPYFKFTNWDGIYNYPSMWRRYFGILLHNFRVYRALATYFRRQSDPIDCVFAPPIVHSSPDRMVVSGIAVRRQKSQKNRAAHSKQFSNLSFRW